MQSFDSKHQNNTDIQQLILIRSPSIADLHLLYSTIGPKWGTLIKRKRLVFIDHNRIEPKGVIQTLNRYLKSTTHKETGFWT